MRRHLLYGLKHAHVRTCHVVPQPHSDVTVASGDGGGDIREIGPLPHGENLDFDFNCFHKIKTHIVFRLTTNTTLE